MDTMSGLIVANKKVWAQYEVLLQQLHQQTWWCITWSSKTQEGFATNGSWYKVKALMCHGHLDVAHGWASMCAIKHTNSSKGVGHDLMVKARCWFRMIDTSTRCLMSARLTCIKGKVLHWHWLTCKIVSIVVGSLTLYKC